MFLKIKKPNFKINIFVFSLVIFFGLFFGVGKVEAVTCNCVINLDDHNGCNNNTDQYSTEFNVSIATQHSISSLLENATRYLNTGPATLFARSSCTSASVLLSGGGIFAGLPTDKINTPERCNDAKISGSFSGTIATYNLSCSVVEQATTPTAAAGGLPTDCENSPLGCDTIAKFKSLNKLNLTGTGGARILIGRAIKAVMGVIGSIALLMFVAGGFMWMTAAGNSERTAKAMRMITWSTLGIVVIFLGYALVNFIFSAF